MLPDGLQISQGIGEGKKKREGNLSTACVRRLLAVLSWVKYSNAAHSFSVRDEASAPCFLIQDGVRGFWMEDKAHGQDWKCPSAPVARERRDYG